LKNRRDLPKGSKELLEGTSLDKKEEEVLERRRGTRRDVGSDKNA
jgi:hypothetical protein